MVVDTVIETLLHSSDRFVAFGASHLTVLALSLLATTALIGFGRRRRQSRVHGWLPRALGVVIVVGEITFCLFPVWLGTFRADWALPLQLCDLTAFITGFGLICGSAFGVEVGFFLGLSATLLTTITPDLAHDFPHIEFFCFFATHALVSVAVAYVTIGLDRRPRVWSGLKVLSFVNAVGIAVAGINVWLGSNYFYICRKPPVASPLDWMGPWPWYVAVLDVVLAALIAALTEMSDRIPRIEEGIE